MPSHHEDIISSLPDHIICHILSFLPTKFAVTTSILSKRWNPLWRSVLTLYFDNETFDDFTSFRNFVSSIFHSRDMTLPLRTFHLKWSKASNLNSHDIRQFVDTAVQRGGIKNLNLEMSGSNNDFKFTLPPTIFSCRTLVVLQLKSVEMNDLTQLVVDFPFLKTLHIFSVIFESVDCLLKLLLGCPILEEFQAEYLRSQNLDLTSTLKNLKGKYPRLPNLIRACITNSSYCLRFLIILVCREEVQVLRVEIGTLSCNYSTFNNLAYMELILYHNHYENWRWLVEVLELCPKLQNLTIQQDSWNGKEVMNNWKDPTIIPKCLLTRFKTCFLKGYKCTESELQFAKYIMQNSQVLKTMSIKSASTIDKNSKNEMLTKLSSLTTASTSCKLLFE